MAESAKGSIWRSRHLVVASDWWTLPARVDAPSAYPETRRSRARASCAMTQSSGDLAPLLGTRLGQGVDSFSQGLGVDEAGSTQTPPMAAARPKLALGAACSGDSNGLVSGRRHLRPLSDGFVGQPAAAPDPKRAGTETSSATALQRLQRSRARATWSKVLRPQLNPQGVDCAWGSCSIPSEPGPRPELASTSSAHHHMTAWERVPKFRCGR